MKLKKVVIIGMGLIGGSIGKAIMKKGLAEEVVGVCRRQSSLDRAVKEQSLSKGYVNSYAEAVPGADVIFIATPVHTIKTVFEDLAKVLKDGKTIVTDVGSTKKEIVADAARLKDSFTFIGGHPLAGSEKAGVEYSSADLFGGSVCILTPDKDTPEAEKTTLTELWKDMGAAVVELTPEKHDESLAFSSHLPHVVAYALMGALGKDFPYAMLASGFKDTTRIAASDSALWSDIFLSNRQNVLNAIERYKEVLTALEKDIQDENADVLTNKLSDYKEMRDGIG